MISVVHTGTTPGAGRAVDPLPGFEELSGHIQILRSLKSLSEMHHKIIKADGPGISVGLLRYNVG